MRGETDPWEDPSFDLWQVQGKSDIRLMTLDDLDGAFKRDEITSRTLIRRPGSADWHTLAEVAGLDESSPNVVVALEDTAPEDNTLAPVALESGYELVEELPRPPPLPRAAGMRLDSVNALKLDAEDPARELAVAGISPPRRGRLKKAATVALVALASGFVFAGTSAWISGALSKEKVASALDKRSAPAATAPVADPNITSTEGSVLVLRPAATDVAKAQSVIPPVSAAPVAAAPPAAAPVVVAPAPPPAHAVAAVAPRTVTAAKPAQAAHASSKIAAHAPPPAAKAAVHASSAHAPAHGALPALAKADAKKGFQAKPAAAAAQKAKH